MDTKTLLGMTTEIVSAHAATNELSQEQLLAEIQNVFAKLSALGGEGGVPTVPIVAEAAEAEGTKPAVPLEAAFGSEKVFCMVCGQGMKTLKRHLKTAHQMMPGEYRRAFGVPSGTPLVAKSYSEQRKAMAKDLNLADRLVKARAAKGKKKRK